VGNSVWSISLFALLLSLAGAAQMALSDSGESEVLRRGGRMLADEPDFGPGSATQTHAGEEGGEVPAAVSGSRSRQDPYHEASQRSKARQLGADGQRGGVRLSAVDGQGEDV